MANVRVMAAEVAQSAFARLTGTTADAGSVKLAVDSALKGGS